MLKIIKELMEHEVYSVMQNPEYWENDKNISLEPLVKYVSKELPKLFASEIRCGLYNLPDYKYIRDYRDLIGMDVKAGFNIVVTDEKVEEKGINFSNGFLQPLWILERYLSVYLKVTYWYKLRPEKRITVYYHFGGSDYNVVLYYIFGEGPTRHVTVENKTRFYSLLVYLLVNSIEIKTPDDFNELDIVVPAPFQHVRNKGMDRIGLMEVPDLIKEEKNKTERSEEKIGKLARHRDDILRGPLENILNVTEKVLYEVLSKEANNQIDAKKEVDKKKAEMEEKEYQEKRRREEAANMRRLQNECWGI